MSKKTTPVTFLFFILIAFMSILLLPPSSIHADTITTGARFLTFGVGARANAMGEAYTSIADDVNAAYWNPAGLAQLQDIELSISHIEFLESVRHEHVAVSYPFAGGTIAFSGTYLWIDGLTGRASVTADERTIPVWDMAPALSYGREIISNLSAGVTVKGIFQTLDDESASGWAADAGLLMKLGGNYSIGAAALNVGDVSAFISEKAPMPTVIRIGASKRFPDTKLLVGLDCAYGINDHIIGGGLGAELELLPQFLIRAGGKYNSSLTSLDFLTAGTLGLGFKMKTVSIDYAFVPYGERGYSHHITVITHFGLRKEPARVAERRAITRSAAQTDNADVQQDEIVPAQQKDEQNPRRYDNRTFFKNHPRIIRK